MPRLSTECIRELFRQLLSGLAAAHEAGLIHRDIKSSNILLDGWPIRAATVSERLNGARRIPEGGPLPHGRGSDSAVTQSGTAVPAVGRDARPVTLKIADFGLARMLGAQTRLTLSDSVLGTAEYMSPEQARGDESLDHRADLYSAGVVLYEMLTARTPFCAGSSSAVIYRILHEPPADPRKLCEQADPHLASLALRLMAKCPEDRFGSAGEAIEALVGNRIELLPHRHRWRRSSLLLSLLVCGVFLGGAWAWSWLTGSNAVSRITAPAKPEVVDAWPGVPDKTNVWVKYVDGSKGVLHAFGPEVDEVLCVVLIEPDQTGSQLVVASVAKAIDGKHLFAFDAEGREVWQRGMSSDREWPDCDPSVAFCIPTLVGADLDDRPGDELVVVTIDIHQYPTRISIIDPRTMEVGTSLWHFGHIAGIIVHPDLLGPGKPGIVAWGVNNKLDGFEEPQEDDHESFAVYDWVSMIMVLDPEEMRGDHLLNVPRSTRCSDMRRTLPYAYAHLDLSADPGVPDVSGGRKNPRYPEEDEVAFVSEARLSSCPDASEAACLLLRVWRGPMRRGGAALIVDRNLDIRRVMPSSGESIGRAKNYWRNHWQPIIQNGAYLDR